VSALMGMDQEEREEMLNVLFNEEERKKILKEL